ncbi:GerAB/ArcD/ProY family transporter [Paenibacillus dendritiformis]|uniref:GerAB/ArcD/ProY family transporter n=1 Tax=Paenibacillus dendritiformis TaxID=130049 RepID=UPI00248BCA7F|nr:GerAB/ArcD/ProY family transporter [Paenibacillus dendritiformis]WGU96112.1 GerAB/ArcD/ProY family transporter [Paenibacillus dendritiformis]
MSNAKDQITPGQLIFLITQTQIGVGLLGLASRVHNTAKGDAWISVLLAGMLAQLFIFIIWCLNKRFPSLTLFDYLPKLLGKAIGKLIQVLYAVYFILVSSFIVIQFSSTVRDWVLFDTPRWIVMGIMIGVSYYLARESLRTIARFFALVFFCNIAVIIIAAFAYLHVNFLYVLPVGQAGIWNIAKGAHEAMTSFSGYEMLLICYPFVEGGSTMKLKAATAANIFTTLMYTFAIFTSLIVFSPPELELLPQPLLYMVKALSFSVVERPDLYFLSLWVVVASTSTIGYLFMASRGGANLFQARSTHRKAVPYVAVLVFVIALIFQAPNMIGPLSKFLAIANYVFVFGIPFVLFIIFVLFKEKEARGSIG